MLNFMIATCSWIKVSIDSGTTFQTTNQIWGQAYRLCHF